MAIWDGKIRWQLGGNVQPVRMICEIDWRSCPSAILDYIWSEIVTDVIECITSEEMMWRVNEFSSDEAITLISVLLILLYAIWKKVGVMTEKVISENMINDINFKLQDLEMRVNVLAYRLQYGAWPFLPKNSKILMTSEEEKAPIKSDENGPSWFRYFLPKCITSSHSQFDLHKSKIHREKSGKSREYHAHIGAKPLNPRENVNDSKKCEEKVLKLESKLKDCEKFIKDIASEKMMIGEVKIEKIREDKATEIEIISEDLTDAKIIGKFDEELIRPRKSRLTQVRKQLESLHTVLRTYGNGEAPIMDSGAAIKRDESMRMFPGDLSDLLSSTESDDPQNSPKIHTERQKISIKNEKIVIVEKNPGRFVENMEQTVDQYGPLPKEEASPVSEAPEKVSGPTDSDGPKHFDDSLIQANFSEEIIAASSCNSVFPELKNCYQMQVLDIIPEEQSGSSCNEQRTKKPMNNAIHVEKADFSHQEVRYNSDEIDVRGDDDSGDEIVEMKIVPVEREVIEVEANKEDDDVKENFDVEEILMEPKDVAQDLVIDEPSERIESQDSSSSIKLNPFIEEESPKESELRIEESSEHLIIEEKSLNFEEKTTNFEEKAPNFEEKAQNFEESTEIGDLKDVDVELLIDVPCFSLGQPLNAIEKRENDPEEGKIEVDDENDLIELDVDDNDLQSGDHDFLVRIEEGSLTRRIVPDAVASSPTEIETLQENMESNLPIRNEENTSSFMELETLALDALTKIDDFWKKEPLVEPIKFNKKVLDVPLENAVYPTMDSLFEEFIETIAVPEGMKDISEIETPETFRKTCNHEKPLIVDKILQKSGEKGNSSSKTSVKSSKKPQRNSPMTTVYQSPYSVKSLSPKAKAHTTASKNEAQKNAKKLSLKARSNQNLSSTKDDLGKQNFSKSSIELSQRRSRSYVTPRKLEASPRASCPSHLPCPLINKRSRPETREKISNSDCKLNEKDLQRTKSKSAIPLLKTRWENAKSTNFVYRSKSPLRSALTMSTNSRASEDSRSLNNEEFVKESGSSDEKDRQSRAEGQTIICVNIVTEQEHSTMKVVNPREFFDYVKDRALKIQGTGEYIENSCASKILTIVCSTVNENEESSSKDIEISAKPSVVNTSTSISYFPKILYLSEETGNHEENL